MKKIFDPLRKKYIEATPEEIVRQNVIQILLKKGVPLLNITTEKQFKIGDKIYRADILVYSQGKPLLLIECKAPSVKINKQTLEQAWRYNKIINAKFIMLTNGKETYICKVMNNTCQPLKYLPNWQELKSAL